MSKKLTLSDRILTDIRRTLPRKPGGRIVEINRADVELFSRIKYVLTTGIKPFDDFVGGFPFGRISEIYGLEGCGKSALAIRAAIRGKLKNIVELVRRDDGGKEFRPISRKKLDVHILHIDNEQSVDEQRNEVDGVEYHSLDIHNARIDTIEDIFKMVETTLISVTAAQKEAQESDPDTLYLCAIIVDTIASTSSMSEMDRDWGEQDYDRRAKAIHEGLRRLVRRINKANIALICTNQVQGKMGNINPRNARGWAMLDNDYTSPGGMGLKYYSSHRIFMHRMPTKYRLAPKAHFSDGELIAFWAPKNRIRKPRREGRLVLLFGDEDGAGGGFSQEYSMLETLIFLGYADVSETGRDITFKFAKHAVVMKTFGDTAMSLDEADSAKGKNKRIRDPKIENRSKWTEFYQAHKQDLDALYDTAIHESFATNVPHDEEDEEDDITGTED